MIVNRKSNKYISEFDNIRTVVMSYSDLESTGAEKDLIYFSYLGKTTEISNNEFIKYNTSFFTEDKLLVNQLQKDILKETGNEVEYLELLEKTIFPTISDNTSSNTEIEILTGLFCDNKESNSGNHHRYTLKKPITKNMRISVKLLKINGEITGTEDDSDYIQIYHFREYGEQEILGTLSKKNPILITTSNSVLTDTDNDKIWVWAINRESLANCTIDLEVTYNYSPVENYFGSTIINNTTIFTYLDIPENINYVYLFDEVFDINNILRKSSDNLLYKINSNKYDHYSISFGEEEVKYRKGLFIFLDKINNNLKVNLSYKAWLDDSEPLRNLKETFLSRKEFNRSLNNIPVTKSLEGYNNYITDIYSGLLLCNTSPVESNILKINKDIKTWDSYSIYNLGDQVFWEDNNWTSICDNNINNIPNLSSDWEITENLTNYFTRQIEVLLEDSNSVIDTENIYGVVYPDKLVNIYPDDINSSFYIKLNPGYFLTNIATLVTSLNESKEINLEKNNYNISLVKSQDFSSLITFEDTKNLLENNIEELKIQISRKIYKLIISLSENTRSKLNSEGDFNMNFKLILNGKQIIYRSSSDTVIEYSKADNDSFVSFKPKSIIDENTGETINEISASEFSNKNIVPKFSWGFKNDEGEIIEILESEEKYTEDGINIFRIENVIDNDGNFTSESGFFLTNDNKVVLDSNGNPVLNIDKSPFSVPPKYYLKDINNNIIYYNNNYPYLNKIELLNDCDKETKTITLFGTFIDSSKSSRLTNITGKSNIQSNNYTVGIGDTFVIEKQISNNIYSINKISDSLGNTVKSYEIGENDSVTYYIKPTEFDNQDLTIEYIIDIIETTYSINFIFENSTGNDKYENIISDKTTKETKIINGANTVSFDIYPIDEYYNKVDIEIVEFFNNLKLYQRNNNNTEEISKKEDISSSTDLHWSGEDRGNGIYRITLGNVNSNFDLVVKYNKQ